MSRKKDSPPASAQISVLITDAQLNTLLKHCRSISKQTAELTGSLREKIAYAKDKQGLHSKAFATLRQIEKMEPEAALEYWTHLLAYLDKSGVMERINSVTRMDLGEEGEVGGAPVKRGRGPAKLVSNVAEAAE